MLVIVFASLIAACFASLPVLEFKDGGCPTVHPSANFLPSQISGKYYVIANTEAGPQTDNCCKCGEITYKEGSNNQIESERRVYTYSGVEKLTKGLYINKATGQYNYQYIDNGDYKDTHMTVTFHQQDDQLLVYGCIPKDGKHADVALVLSRTRTSQVSPAIKQALSPSGLTELQTVNQDNCTN